MYCVSSLAMPHLRILGDTLSYEILCFIPMFLICVYEWTVLKKFKLHKEYYVFAIIEILYIISTILSAIVNGGTINFIGWFGMIRMFFIFIILTQDGWTDEVWDTTLKILVALNFASVFIQVFIPKSNIIFRVLYQRDNVYNIMDTMWNGIYRRCFGAFHTPTWLGYLGLMAFVYFMYKILSKKVSYVEYIYIVMSVVIGAASAMKMFFIGMILAVCGLVFGVIVKKIAKKEKDVDFDKKKAVGILISIILILGICTVYDHMGVHIVKKIKECVNIETAIEARYDAETGTAAGWIGETNSNIETNIKKSQLFKVIGYGATTLADNAVSDSEWMMLYHDVGIVGIIIWLVFLMCLFGKNITPHIEIDKILMLGLVVVVGFTAKNALSFIGIYFISYIFTIRKQIEGN